MVARTLRRLASAADLLRPQTFFRTLAQANQTADRTRELSAIVAALCIRTEKLEAIQHLDWELRDEIADLPRLLDSERIEAHVRRAVAAAPMACDPFPYLVVNDWLPADVYQAVIRGLPPAVFFADREIVRQRLLVPFALAPVYSRMVWSFMAHVIVGRILRDSLNDRFAAVVREYVETFCPAAGLDLRLEPSDGRIMLRRPGYVITPHRDPKWGFVTGLVYLARNGDMESYGTQFYRVRDDEDAPSDKPYYVDQARCEEVAAVPFRANTLVAFLNSRGAHGASIPADAKPATLERYLYQFRLGPDIKTIKRLVSMMEPGHREHWGGHKKRRAGQMDDGPDVTS